MTKGENTTDTMEIKFWDKGKINRKSGLWFIQLKSMLKKNFTLQFRFWKTSIVISIITPLLTMLMFKFLIFIKKNSWGKQILYPEKYTLDGVADCFGPAGNENNCINIMYTNCIDGAICERDPAVDEIMSNFVKNNNQRTNNKWETESAKWENWSSENINTEVKEKHDVIHVPNSDFIYDYTLKHPNVTNYGVLFDVKRVNDLTNFRYQLWFNSTSNYNETDSYSTNVAGVARGIDEAIVQFANGNPNVRAQFNFNLKDFPDFGKEGYEEFTVSIAGPMFFFCVSMVIFINILNTLVNEKESKVRYSMEMMGLKQSVYWVSWIIIYLIYYVINTLSTILFGKLFGYSFFNNANFGALFLLFFVYSIAMGAMAMFITTFVKSSKTSILIGIFMLIIGFLINCVIFQEESLAYLFWSDSVPEYVTKLFSIFVPFFNFGKMYMDISKLSSNSYNYITSTIVEGKGFYWSDLFEKPQSTLSVRGGYDLSRMEPPINALYYLLISTGIYVVLALYFDNVVPNVYGNRKSLLYFLVPSYWFKRSSSVKPQQWIQNTQKKYKSKINIKELDGDVQEHYRYTCDPNANDSPVKIINLRKVYGRGKKKNVAIKNTCLSMGMNKVVALLGQNGAGKSTTMNIISGLTRPTAGDISVFDKSLRKNPSAVQAELGICPQEDILFKDLTAMEHLRLYSGLKGAKNCKELDEILINRLKAVQLYTVKDARSKTYSGGMKRRLSMIIATIGDPNVILLDEPTTGMDPVNRRYVWQFVEEFKKGRCVLLTTHSMEEAEALGDDIVIMSKGVVKALGNSIHLKNKFGNGYRISVLVDQENTEKLKAIASKMVPGIHLADDSAGALIYDFNYQQAQYIPRFVKYLDSNPDHYVNTWGMSQTTLEEVFLNVIHDDSNRRFKEE
ncbi:hypothetical protein PIROE2DRAFT_20971 [Piromyces sp. E2]|nr:hypothetical protein PIROE2DRAFT_20971 [Piromyces sp. E2]|eukprot:OUM61279.1 hypothetical protein PIROE2DRAFT_20971 [Piromyces sp. E2]